MFGLVRPKSRATLARAELGESFDHLRQAASYATSGVNAAVAPRVRAARMFAAPKAARARDAAAGGWGSTAALLMPLATIAGRAWRAGSVPQRRSATPSRSTLSVKSMNPMSLRPKSPKSMRRRRWPMAGLLAMGAIAGTAGVMALRRRREGEWKAYDPAADLDVVHRSGSAAVPDRQPASHHAADATRSAEPANSIEAAKPNGAGKSNGHATGTAKASAAVPAAAADQGSKPGTA